MRSFRPHRSLAVLAAVLCLAALVPMSSQTAAPTISFRIVVLESQDAAERVLAQLRNGENFVVLAGAVSVDPSAADGGLVGPVRLSDLRPELRNVLTGLRPGELSGVLRLPTGFGILKLVPQTDPAASP